MSVSVITPARNAERYLSQTIESVLRQTLADWELVIVDDGSTDATAAIAHRCAREDGRIRVVQRAGLGTANARNHGLAAADPRHGYVAFLDHDDLLEPDALETLQGVLEARPLLIGIHGQRRNVDTSGAALRRRGSDAIYPLQRRGVVGRRLRLVPDSAPTTFSVLAYADCIPANALMVRRKAIQAVGPFDPAAFPCDDWDMWLRLSRRGDFAFVRKVIYSWRCHDSNASRDRERMRRNALYVRRKLYGLGDLTAEERRAIVLGYRFYELHLALERVRSVRACLLRKKWKAAGRLLRDAFAHVRDFAAGEL